jgi:hydrogenase-4 component B
VLSLLAVGGLALVGGLAALCFVRLVGVTLLGAARSEPAARAHESSPWMLGPVWALVLCCVAMGVFPRPVLAMLSRPLEQLLVPAVAMEDLVAPGLATLGRCSLALWAMLASLGVVLAVGYRRRTVSDLTWGCGYAAPSARMQYTAGSFSETLTTRLLPPALRARAKSVAPHGIFPTGGSYATECLDPLTRGVYEPLFARWGARFSQLRWLQQGHVYAYVLYILTVVVLGLTWVGYLSWADQ